MTVSTKNGCAKDSGTSETILQYSYVTISSRNQKSEMLLTNIRYFEKEKKCEIMNDYMIPIQ